jgi:hypothetical protein
VINACCLIEEVGERSSLFIKISHQPSYTRTALRLFTHVSSTMSGTAKMDHEMSEHNGTNIAGNGAELSRQVTVALSPEQYERLFFQPSAPRRGDFAKRFGEFLRSLHVEFDETDSLRQVTQRYSAWSGF